MLKLPDVTLIAIDTFKPQRTHHAMKYSLKWVRFGAAKLLTNWSKLDELHPDIRLVPHTQNDELMVRFPNGSKPNTAGYELSQLRVLHHHFDTSHCLFVEWDSAVLNPIAWDRKWLKYDYIGAPWPPHHDPGWPACDGETNAVGNGGFSLRSHRFCARVAQATEEFRGDPAMLSSDRWVCRTIRPWLEQRGMRFAPYEVAERFSCENRIYAGQFGFHGRKTAAMNNWGDWLDHIRP